VCLFLASNIYAVNKCRWFSPLIVILGASCLRSASAILTCQQHQRQACAWCLFRHRLTCSNGWWTPGDLQWTFLNVIWLSYLINAHDTNPWQGNGRAVPFLRRQAPFPSTRGTADASLPQSGGEHPL